MPIGPQPRTRRGTIDRPYSALNLRLALALLGLVLGVVFAIVLFRTGPVLLAWLMILIAASAAADIVIIQLRRRARRRDGDARDSLFE
jgi:hypothetical protein